MLPITSKNRVSILIMNSQHFQQITSKEVVSSEEEEERENIFQDTLAPNLIRVKPGEKTFFVSAFLNLEHKRFYVWFRLVRWSLPILITFKKIAKQWLVTHPFFN